MRKKIFLFPGFVQDATAFAPLQAILENRFEVICVNYLTILPEIDTENANIIFFAKRLVEIYKIQNTDILIGHSFGGWVAANIQQLTSSPCVLIASFTNPRKPVHAKIGFNPLGFSLIRAGSFKWGFLHKIVLYRYRNKPQLPSIQNGIHIMKTWKNEDLLKITRLIAFQPQITSPTAPLLRIHSNRDEVVSPPDEPHICIPNASHGIHYTHAAWLSRIIESSINSEFSMTFS